MNKDSLFFWHWGKQVQILATWMVVDASGLHKLKGRQVLARGLHCGVSR